MALTSPDQSIRTPQTKAIGPNPAAPLPAIRTMPPTTNAEVMVQKNLACLMVISLSSPSWGRHDPSRKAPMPAIGWPDRASGWRGLPDPCHDEAYSAGKNGSRPMATGPGGRNMLNNRFAREALKQAATQVNQGVRDGARQFIEREITPLRDRVDELEGRVARLERQLAELVRERDRTGR
jgi:hypothetical protein